MSEFATAVKNFQHKVVYRTNKVFQDSCRDVSLNIASKSPVSTGRLLGQWAPSAGSQTSHSFSGGPSAWKGVAGGYQKDEGTAAMNRGRAMGNLIPRIMSVTSALTTAQPYYFTNNTQYIQQAEHDGWRGTGPYHMIEQGKLGWKQTVLIAAARVKSG